MEHVCELLSQTSPTHRSGRQHTPNNVAGADGGTARHTRASTVSCPTNVADCRRLRLRHSGAQLRQETF